MTRNLKTLGLALVAALALSAVATAGASAQTHTFRTSAGQTAHLTAQATGDQVLKKSTNDTKEFVCKKMNIVQGTGTVVDSATSITAQPNYTECTAYKGANTTEGVITFTEFTSCHYDFKNATTEGNPTGGKHANLAIKCTTPGDVIHLKVTALKIPCVTIPEQEIKHAVTYTNITDPGTGKKAIEIDFTPHSIKSETPDTLACPDPEVHTDGTYVGSVVVTGFKDVNHTEPTDVFFE
jgi:uncharacterized lipoprotein YehR (DUF1307 family)